ncbi:developmental protein-like protein fluG [Cryomyces antarcticus]
MQHSPLLDDLRTVIRTCPVIDNHAHNLLRPTELGTYAFETITTEAHGEALKDTFKSLSHIRAARQLRELYGCDAAASWDEVVAKRAQVLKDDSNGLIKRCLEGTHCILMDDGLDADTVHEYDWHDQFTTSKTKRIVRIESVAQDLMEVLTSGEQLSWHEDNDESRNDDINWIWIQFTEAFQADIEASILDPEVVGFKSVVCYRTGLDIRPTNVETRESINASFRDWVASCRKGECRLEHKGFNDALVELSLKCLSDSGKPKPVQFHTGLGDADINLLLSNPAHLQPLIERYPTVPFVLLHSSYPYTREAGYLATVFKNVYLDIGEVFPMLSRDGQLSIVRQSLELVPTSKLLWSTDGHWFPETYWLANKQFREVLEEVLVDYVHKEDLSVSQAIDFVRDIMFNNSNDLYALGETLQIDTAPTSSKAMSRGSADGRQQLENFLQREPAVEFVCIQWLDYMATTRTRILPIAEFSRLVAKDAGIGISRGSTGTLQNDAVTPACTPVGQIYVRPDLSTLRRTHAQHPLPSATVHAFFHDEHGQMLPECPRGVLQRLLQRTKDEHDITFLIGFEIEVTFLRRVPGPSATFEPWTTNQAWSTLTDEQYVTSLPVLAEMVKALLGIGIAVQQFHTESGQGQYEFVLPPLPALEAIDTLLQARQVVQQLAASHALRATLHPTPLRGIGTAAHAHVSLHPAEREGAFFVAGVLAHLDALCALTLPEAASYGRVRDDAWSGGTWVAWGSQNRETPLRRVRPGRWEVRCLDGLANMYLAVAALVGAGLLGLREGSGAGTGAGVENPSRLTPEQREELGITRRLPPDIHTSLDALEHDGALAEVLGAGLVSDYVAMKRAEQTMLGGMGEEERRVWLLERY